MSGFDRSANIIDLSACLDLELLKLNVGRLLDFGDSTIFTSIGGLH